MMNAPGQRYLRVHLLRRRVWSHAKNAIFTLQPNAYTRLEVTGNECRHANTEVDVESILQLFSSTLCSAMAHFPGVFFLRSKSRLFARR